MPGKPVWLYAKASEGADPITTEKLFWTASITKTFTAAAVLQLVDEGKLSLTDQVHQFLPAYPNVDSTITILQLLNHTSGVFNDTENPLYDQMMEEDRSRKWTPEEIITRMVLKPYFRPGQGWHYSNSDYILLGMIIKRVTANALSKEFRDRFYRPLGLNHTYLDAEETITGQFANFWADFDGNGVEEEVPVLSVERWSETSSAWAAGGIFSTAEDIARWTYALFHGNVLSPTMLQQMLTFHMPISSSFPGYGCGVLLYPTSLTSGARAYGHDGNAHYYISDTIYLPDYDVSITILQNEANGTVQAKVREAVCKVFIDARD
jgi:D-alanyl-D-alanine carboxypeptidase